MIVPPQLVGEGDRTKPSNAKAEMWWWGIFPRQIRLYRFLFRQIKTFTLHVFA